MQLGRTPADQQSVSPAISLSRLLDVSTFVRMPRSRTTPAAPRRTPCHAEGQQIVDAILGATVQILGEEGYDKLTTNRIAQVAGVSIGSLYRYFPNKQAIISAVAQSLEREALARFSSALMAVASEPVDVVARAVICWLATERFGKVSMRRELLRHVPRSWIEDTAHGVDAAVEQALSDYLARRSDLRPGEGMLMAFVLVHAVESVVEAAVLRRQDVIHNEQLLDELVQLVVSYLSGPACEQCRYQLSRSLEN